MKNIFIRLFAAGVLVAAASCSEHYPMYDLKDTRLGFRYVFDENAQKVLDSTIRYTFVYQPATVTEDTVWVELKTSGFLSDADRSFEIEQVPAAPDNIHTSLPEGAEVINAEPGVHYRPFTEAGIKEKMVVKGGCAEARFPVVFFRHADMQKNKIYLRLKVKENANFKESFPADRFMVIESSDMLSKPKEWGLGAIEYYFTGPYSDAKLRFMIDNASWKVDDKWFAEHFSSYSVDMGYTGYLSTYFTNKLIEVNDARIARGEDVIKDDKGNPIYFVNYGTPQPYKSGN